MREEVEANWQNANKDEAGAEPNGQNSHKANKAPQQKVERAEVSGRKARGRKPLSPEEKAARAKARAAAKAEGKKETKPKPLTSARDDAVNMLSDVILSHMAAAQSIRRDPSTAASATS